HSGGILGGISDGSPLLLRASFKPTPSIAQVQTMLGRDGACHEESIHGRHDPIIVSRAVVVVEAMTALTLADHLLLAMTSRMDKFKKFYLDCAKQHGLSQQCGYASRKAFLRQSPYFFLSSASFSLHTARSGCSLAYRP